MNCEVKFDLKGLNVMLAVPGGRNPDWRTVADLMETKDQLTRLGVPLTPVVIQQGAIITKVRDELVHQFWKSDCNRIFWLDDDMRWAPDDFIKLVALSTKVDCVAAAYVAKKEPPTFYVKAVPTDKDKQLSEFGLMEIEGCGLGFACMTREVIEAVVKTKPLAFDQMRNEQRAMVFRTDISPEGFYRGEDVAFFADVREAGFKVWCDPMIELGHFGSKEYRGRLWDVVSVRPQEAATA